MKRKIIFFIVHGFFVSVAQDVLGQPTPGDSGLGAASGNVVGGGSADLSGALWLWLLPAILYIAYKQKDQIFQWHLNL